MKIIYTHRGECDRLEDVPDGAIIETIDDRPVIGRCEACGQPVLDDGTGNRWVDGVWTCSACSPQR